jgi:hypothetical protein
MIKLTATNIKTVAPPQAGLVIRVLLCFALMAAPAMATIVVQMDLPRLVELSDSIVEGTVSRVDVKWDPTAKMIYTDVAVRISDRLKGDRSQEVTVRQQGGRIGAMSVYVSGSPTFEIGQQLILFLDGQAGGTFGVVGLNQGKYEIQDGIAVSSMTGLEVLNQKTGQIESPSARSTSIDAETLKARIRGLVK